MTKPDKNHASKNKLSPAPSTRWVLSIHFRRDFIVFSIKLLVDLSHKNSELLPTPDNIHALPPLYSPPNCPFSLRSHLQQILSHLTLTGAQVLHKTINRWMDWDKVQEGGGVLLVLIFCI